MFHIGQKVVYVGLQGRSRDRRFDVTAPPFKLTKGQTYTIRDIDFRNADKHYGVPTIRLEEMVLPTVKGWERGYCPWLFRPVTERKTDISIFTKMLSPTTRRQIANAGEARE